VSGEILFIDGPGGSASRLVRALRGLADEVPPSEFALIGGLAVMTRLGRVHRATDDLDAAAHSVDGGPSRLSVLVGGGESGQGRRSIEGVKVDCIDVGSSRAVDLDPGDLPDDEFDRAFLLAHRWALDSATEAVLSAVSEQRVPVATAMCRVAIPAALVAMKLQSAPRRRAERAHKLRRPVRAPPATRDGRPHRRRTSKGSPRPRPLVRPEDRDRAGCGSTPHRQGHSTDRAPRSADPR